MNKIPFIRCLAKLKLISGATWIALYYSRHNKPNESYL